MNHSLVNPNKILITGMSFSDDPFDENWELGISHEKVSIPFKTDRGKVYFDSIVPTQRDITECSHIIMTGKMKWGPRLVILASVQTKKDAEIHKIYDIARAPKCYELKTEILLGGIGDVFVERAMTEHLVASISIQGVKIKSMKSNTRHYVITPEEVSNYLFR